MPTVLAVYLMVSVPAALGSVFVLSPLALLVALAINSRLVRWKAFYRLALFFPVIISQVVVAVIFSRVLDTQSGLLNQFLGWFGVPPVGWPAAFPDGSRLLGARVFG